MDPLSLIKDIQRGPEGKIGGLGGGVLWSKAVGSWTPSSPEEGAAVLPSLPCLGAAFGRRGCGQGARGPGARPAPAATRAASRRESVAGEADGLRAAGEAVWLGGGCGGALQRGPGGNGGRRPPRGAAAALPAAGRSPPRATAARRGGACLPASASPGSPRPPPPPRQPSP